MEYKMVEVADRYGLPNSDGNSQYAQDGWRAIKMWRSRRTEYDRGFIIVYERPFEESGS